LGNSAEETCHPNQNWFLSIVNRPNIAYSQVDVNDRGKSVINATPWGVWRPRFSVCSGSGTLKRGHRGPRLL